MGKLLSVHEAAAPLGVSFWTVYRLARGGRMVSVRLGRRTLFAEEDIEELIRTHRSSVQSGPGAKELGNS